MTKFKEGDTVYSFRYGIVTLVMGPVRSVYPIGIKVGEGVEGHTVYGKCLTTDKYPCLITLEKAEKLGLVKKKVTGGGPKRVKYYDDNAKTYLITWELYKSVEDFETDYGNSQRVFKSFVDYELNECPIPGGIEWEEIT